MPREKRVAAVRVIGQIENEELLKECQTLVREAKSRRDIDAMLAMPFGRLSGTDYNRVVQAFVEELTQSRTADTSSASSSSSSSSSKRQVYQAEAM